MRRAQSGGSIRHETILLVDAAEYGYELIPRVRALVAERDAAKGL